MNVQNVCRFNKFGFCKFAMTCRIKHVDELCEAPSCEINLCEKRHPRICKFFYEFGRCKFGDYCRYNHKRNEGNSNSEKNLIEEIDNLKEQLQLKDDQIAAIVNKIDTIVHFLKTKDLEDKVCETDENVVLHQLNDNLEYDRKVDFILENENDWEILEDSEIEIEAEISEPAVLDCPLCETKTFTEIRNIAHVWKNHQAKSTLLLIPKTPP